MRIALAAHHVRPGGGQDRYLLELARHLSRRHEVHLITIRAEGCEGLPIGIHRVSVRERPMLWTAPRFAAKAGRMATQLACDVTHSVGGALPGAAVITAQYVHAAWHEAAKRYGVREHTRLRRLYHDRVGRQSEAFERQAYASKRLKAIIAVSRRTAAELERFYDVPAARVTVIPNGVDPASFNAAANAAARLEIRKSLKLEGSARIALLMGTYLRKGLDTAIAAVAAASGDLHLVVAGTGNTEWANEQAEAAGLAGRLHLLGARSDPERLFAAADVFVLPTRYEPFGMVIVEAMASGVPVVVSGIAGAAELIRHGENGYIVAEPTDVAGFTAQIRAALDPATASVVGRAARMTALGVAWSRIAELTEVVYQRAAAR